MIEGLGELRATINEYEQKVQLTTLPSGVLTKLELVLSDKNVLDIARNVTNYAYRTNLTKESLYALADTLSELAVQINAIKNEFDITIFLKDGERLDLEKLQEQFKVKNLRAQFPDLDIEKLVNLYRNPPQKLKTNHSEEWIDIDEYTFRKYVISVIQMIFNEMDLLMVYVGSEGVGKSTLMTQDIATFYYILTQIKLISYDYNIREIMYNSLASLLEAEDKYFDDKFRLLALDEGNEVSRQNWKEEDVQTFFQRLRRERFNQRIKFIGLPVLGELLTNIVLSRVNIVHRLYAKNNLKTGTLEKGYAELYIIPRGEKIYSPVQKKELYKEDILQNLYDNMKDKSYLTGIPKSLLVKERRFNGVWGFDRNLYIKYLKKTNETFSVNKGMTLSEWEMFLLYQSNPTMKKLGIKINDPRYATVAKFFAKIRARYEKNPVLMQKLDAVYKRKVESNTTEDTGEESI